MKVSLKEICEIIKVTEDTPFLEKEEEYIVLFNPKFDYPGIESALDELILYVNDGSSYVNSYIIKIKNDETRNDEIKVEYIYYYLLHFLLEDINFVDGILPDHYLSIPSADKQNEFIEKLRKVKI